MSSLALPLVKDLPERIHRGLDFGLFELECVAAKVPGCRPLSLLRKVTLKNCRGVERLKDKVCLYRLELKMSFKMKRLYF